MIAYNAINAMNMVSLFILCFILSETLPVVSFLLLLLNPIVDFMSNIYFR